MHGLILGALLGGVAGGALGFIEAGPLGVAVGAPAGSIVGAAAGHLVTQFQGQHIFYEVGQSPPRIRLRLTVQFGNNLEQVAARVRAEVARTIRERTGLHVGAIDVEFVEVVPPRLPEPPTAIP